MRTPCPLQIRRLQIQVTDHTSTINSGLEPNVQPTDPNALPVTPYTIPTLRFDDKTVIMDSKKIITELEKRYPEPSLHLDSPALAQVEALIPKLALPIRTLWIPRLCKNVLNPESEKYFRRTREARVGMSLEEFEKSVPDDQAFERAEPAFREAAELLKRNGGPFVLGEQGESEDVVMIETGEHFSRFASVLRRFRARDCVGIHEES
jgi:Glutathione S-transferase, N-terminal domain